MGAYLYTLMCTNKVYFCLPQVKRHLSAFITESNHIFLELKPEALTLFCDKRWIVVFVIEEYSMANCCCCAKSQRDLIFVSN